MEMLTVVTESEVKLLPWTVVSCKGRLITEGEIRKGLRQIILINKYESGEEELIFCQSVVEGNEKFPLFIVNASDTTRRRNGIYSSHSKREPYDSE